MRVADYVANFLVDKGVKDIFMLTGYGAMYINDAIELFPEEGLKSPMMTSTHVVLPEPDGPTNAI